MVGIFGIPYPNQSVAYRLGAAPSREMVNVVEEDVSKSNVMPSLAADYMIKDVHIFLRIKAWVKNVTYRKNVWIDVHLFDNQGNLINAETFTLSYLGPAGGDGDFFVFNEKIYSASIYQSNFSPQPEAKLVQYRLYYEVNNQVFTDDLLHQQELQEMSEQTGALSLLECRLSKSFLEALPEQAKSVFASAEDWVLFAYAFSYLEDVSTNVVEQLVWDGLHDAQTELASSLYIDLDVIEVRRGSWEIIIFVHSIITMIQQYNIGPILLWAGQTTLSGALAKLGEKLLERFTHKSNVKNIGDCAEKIASDIATSYQCRKVPTTGGNKSSNGKYQYTYQLIGCRVHTATGRSKKDPFFTVTIDPFSKEPDQWEFAP